MPGSGSRTVLGDTNLVSDDHSGGLGELEVGLSRGGKVTTMKSYRRSRSRRNKASAHDPLRPSASQHPSQKCRHGVRSRPGQAYLREKR
eukprot:748128-Hanusia_phi.AAC.7